MGKVIIFPETTENPITLMGKMAGVSYGTNTSDEDKNYARGMKCYQSGHYRVLEFPQVFMQLKDYSARVIREFYTHIGGMPTRIQSSTRYVDESNFDYDIPKSIAADSMLSEEYKTYMDAIKNFYSVLIEDGVSKEDAANILPLGMTTTVNCRMNARELMAIAEQRLCTRAYWEFQNLIQDVITALSNYSEEWETLCADLMLCKCEKVGFCKEELSCGLYPKIDN